MRPKLAPGPAPGVGLQVVPCTDEATEMKAKTREEYHALVVLEGPSFPLREVRP